MSLIGIVEGGMMGDQITRLFEQKEQEIMDEVVSKAKTTAMQEMKLFELELLCSVIISDEEKKGVAK